MKQTIMNFIHTIKYEYFQIPSILFKVRLSEEEI